MSERIKVTKIGKRFHARLFLNENLIDEMACDLKIDIGYICREMLVWFDKIGRSSDYSSFSRKRQNSKPLGKIWYKNQLE
jgi:hypothetical protein